MKRISANGDEWLTSVPTLHSASFAAVSVPGGSGFRPLLSHKQYCPPYPASRYLTMNNQNQARQRVNATERNQTQGKPRPVAYLRRYDFTLASLA
jgi:hypothetical protein